MDSVWQHLFRAAKPSRNLYPVLVLLSVAKSSFFVCESYLLVKGLQIITRETALSIWQWFLLFSGNILAYRISTYAITMVSRSAVERNGAELKARIFKQLQLAPLEAELHTGDSVTRLTADADSASSAVPISLMELVSCILNVGFSLAYCFTISWRLSLVVLFTVPASVLVTQVFFDRVQRDYVARGQAESELRSFLQEQLSRVPVIKIFSLFEDVLGNLLAVGQERMERSVSLARSRLLQFYSSNFLGYFSIMSTLCVGAWSVASGRIDVAKFLAFMGAAEGGVIWPISDIPMYFAALAENKGAMQRLLEVVQVERESPATRASVEGVTNVVVALKNVSFAFEDGPDILKDINITIPTGQSVCIVGDSGAGKKYPY